MYTTTIPRCNLSVRQAPARQSLTRSSYGRRRLAGYARSLGDSCAIDATSGLRVCNGDAAVANVATGQVAAVSTSNGVACTVGQPRYYPATMQNPANAGTTACVLGQPRYFAASFTPSGLASTPQNTPAHAVVAPDSTTWTVTSFSGGSLTLVGNNKSDPISYTFLYNTGGVDAYQKSSGGGPSWDSSLSIAANGAISFGASMAGSSGGSQASFTFQYHAGSQDVYFCSSTNQWGVATAGSFQITTMPPAQNESACGGSGNFVFNYHSGNEDVYYCSATNQWATADPSGFNIVSFPPAANETTCTSAALAVAGMPSVAYVNDSGVTTPYFTSDATSITPLPGYGTTSTTPTVPVAPAPSGLMAMWNNLATWQKIAVAGGGGWLALKLMKGQKLL
jgi:hypothetical protein